MGGGRLGRKSGGRGAVLREVYKGARKDDKYIEASTAQILPFETDRLHSAFCAAEYMAKAIEESDFESELDRETELSVLGALVTSACCDSPG